MNKKMAALAEANQLDGVFVADFEDDAKLGKGKDKVETLSKLIAVFQNENLDFSKNRAADDDLIGDAYEYLMKNFATESGKSKGQFYTPAEVSRVMAKVIGLGDARNGKKTTIYDPTCGSGSLLLRAMCETPDGATIYGQEKDRIFRQAHDCCFSNKEQIEKSEKCGCFSCCEIFTPSEITDYLPDEPPTAECPFCHIDSVIGDASGFPITKDFLKKMKKKYF